MIFIPYEGTDKFKFGDSPEKCISVLGNNFTHQRAALPDIYPGNVSYYFNNSAIQLVFDYDKLEFIGINYNSSIKFGDVDFFKMTFPEVKEWLQCNGDCWEDSTGIISISKGLGFYFDDKEEGTVSQFCLFPKGYYDEFKDDFTIV